MKVKGWKSKNIGRVEGGKVGRLEGGKVQRSKPKPHGSLYLPQFLPYTLLTKNSGGDLWSPPTNKIYTPKAAQDHSYNTRYLGFHTFISECKFE